MIIIIQNSTLSKLTIPTTLVVRVVKILDLESKTNPQVLQLNTQSRQDMRGLTNEAQLLLHL